MPSPLTRPLAITVLSTLTLLAACSESSNPGTGTTLGSQYGGTGGSSPGGGASGDSATGGSAASKGGSGGSGGSGPVGVAGSAGVGGEAASAGSSAGGSEASGGTGGAGGNGSGGPGNDFAGAFANEAGESPCSSCLREKCEPQIVACGDVSTTGTGACATAVACLENETAQPYITSYDCAFRVCAQKNAIDAVQEMFGCTADRCGAVCYLKQDFTSCQ